MKEILTGSLYLWGKSVLEASVYEGNPYSKPLFIKISSLEASLYKKSLLEDFIYKVTPY